MAITEFRSMARERSRDEREADDGHARGLDGHTVGAVLLCGWVWAVFIFLGWGLLHSTHLSLG